MHRHTASRTLRCADYLNAAAVVALLATLLTMAFYQPSWTAKGMVSPKDEGPLIPDNIRPANLRSTITINLSFWTILYLVKLSFMMLYRALFKVSKTFRAAWWGVMTFTTLAFLSTVLTIPFICGSLPHASWSGMLILVSRLLSGTNRSISSIPGIR